MLHMSIGCSGGDGDLFPAGELVVEHLLQAGDVVDLFAGEAEGFDVFFRLKLQGENTHTDEVGAVDALVALSEYEADTQQPWPLGCPVAAGAGAVLFACKDG